MFIFLVGLVALLVASCGAFFSIQGLATLYSGQFLAVCIMGSSLEIGKIIATSYLQRYWRSSSKLLKTYLIGAILVLSGITSLGIFGFLSSAYQKNLSIVETVDSQLSIKINKKEFVTKEIDNLNSRISTLNSARESQEKRLPSMSRQSAKPIYEDIERAGNEIKDLQERINNFNTEINSIDLEIQNLTSKKKQVNDIGTLQYVAKIFNTQTDIIIKWFTLCIVVVFDPFAISLVMAYNNLVKKPSENFKEDIKPTKILEPVKYRR